MILFLCVRGGALTVSGDRKPPPLLICLGRMGARIVV